MNLKIGDKVRYSPVNIRYDFCVGTYEELEKQGVIGAVGTIIDEILYITDSKIFTVYLKTNGGEKELSLDARNLQPINLIQDISDEEIWEMLKPKMEKLRINSIYFMPMEDVRRLVATVYRSAYARGQKGRSFVIGEKKNGHWEWIKPNEIVPDGTKVRYMKKSENDNGDRNFWPELKQECIKANPPVCPEKEFWIKYKGTSFKFVYKGSGKNCFQKWVEE